MACNCKYSDTVFFIMLILFITMLNTCSIKTKVDEIKRDLNMIKYTR